MSTIYEAWVHDYTWLNNLHMSEYMTIHDCTIYTRMNTWLYVHDCTHERYKIHGSEHYLMHEHIWLYMIVHTPTCMMQDTWQWALWHKTVSRKKLAHLHSFEPLLVGPESTWNMKRQKLILGSYVDPCIGYEGADPEICEQLVPPKWHHRGRNGEVLWEGKRTSISISLILSFVDPWLWRESVGVLWWQSRVPAIERSPNVLSSYKAHQSSNLILTSRPSAHVTTFLSSGDRFFSLDIIWIVKIRTDIVLNSIVSFLKKVNISFNTKSFQDTLNPPPSILIKLSRRFIPPLCPIEPPAQY